MDFRSQPGGAARAGPGRRRVVPGPGRGRRGEGDGRGPGAAALPARRRAHAAARLRRERCARAQGVRAGPARRGAGGHGGLVRVVVSPVRAGFECIIVELLASVLQR